MPDKIQYQLYTKVPTGAFNLAATADSYEEAVRIYVELVKSRKLTDVFISQVVDMHVEYCPVSKEYTIIPDSP